MNSLQNDPENLKKYAMTLTPLFHFEQKSKKNVQAKKNNNNQHKKMQSETCPQKSWEKMKAVCTAARTQDFLQNALYIMFFLLQKNYSVLELLHFVREMPTGIQYHLYNYHLFQTENHTKDNKKESWLVLAM